MTSKYLGISQLWLCLFHRAIRYFSVVLVFVSQGHGEGQYLAPEEGKTLVLFSSPYLSLYSEKHRQIICISAECVPLVEFMLYHVFTRMPVESHRM